MYRVLNCLATQHDHRLVLLAAAVCALASLTAVCIHARSSRTTGLKRLGWAVLTGVATGSGIWATHFVAMLAYDPGLPTSYEPVLTVASLLIAVSTASAGFLLARAGAAWQPVVGGAVVGAGISSMHYTGMAAVSVPGTIEWDHDLVVVSVVLGILLSILALLALASSLRWSAKAGAAILLTLAICAMHFTAMGAAVLVPDPTVVVTASVVDNGAMAIAIAGVAFLVLLSGLSAALIDSQTNRETLIRIRELADASLEGIVLAKTGVILEVNRRVADLVGRSIADLVGQPVSCLLSADGSDFASGDPTEVALLTAAGETLPVEVVRRPFRNGLFANEVFSIRDLRERREAEGRIRYLSHNDALTGLPNRASLEVQLAARAGEAAASNAQLGVLCVDLAYFKDINEVFGHAAGDLVLREAARRIRGVMGRDDVIARVGGDDFVILQVGQAQPNGAADLSRRLIESFQEPFAVDDQYSQLGVSIGIALLPQDGTDGVEVLKNAEVALSRAKDAESRDACFFEKEFDDTQRRRRRLAQELRGALSENQLELHYQPQVRVPSGEVIGFEALLRWRHPNQGLVSPATFIPLAEETGLILPIGEWVLAQACRDGMDWGGSYKIAVNLSAKQLQQTNLPEVVHGILLETGFPASRLELEVTETALITRMQTPIAVLRRLKALGLTIAMDDFGTGYSSLSTLQAFPFDKLKIDRSFVNLLGSGKQASAIVKSVLSLGRSLDIPVLAEGVENAQQLAFLITQKCDAVQGFYFGKPAPATEIRAKLARGACWEPESGPAAAADASASPKTPRVA